MQEAKERNHNVELKGTANLSKRLEVLTLLFQKSEAKVTHADTYRQRNMNYALVIFAGLIGLGVSLKNYSAQAMVSATLFIFMLIFCFWDRRWHRIKHGWQSTANMTYRLICDMTNNPDKDLDYPLYNWKGEGRAEYNSWQPIVFYFLVFGALSSFGLFGIVKD